MSKAAHIIALWKTVPDGPQKTRIIADKVGCTTTYARVVGRQRKGTISRFDRAYRSTEAFRANNRIYMRAYMRDRRKRLAEARA